MMSAIKSGVVSHSRFAKMAERDFKVTFQKSDHQSDYFDGVCICMKTEILMKLTTRKYWDVGTLPHIMIVP